jgi:hypothetical protein
MRFATNPSDLGFRAWAADYHARYLQANPLADGLLVDNSGGPPPAAEGAVLEPLGAYAGDYGALLNAVARAVAPRWLLANTSGGNAHAEPVVQRIQGYYEEFALRPLAHNHQHFEDLAASFARRQSLRTPAPYAVFDTLPAGGSPTDPRTQLASLAYYYLLADPESTFLNLFGGYEPASSWARHWTPAVAFDVGRPRGGWSQFVSGNDPANAALRFRVYQRDYDNALVLYKPLSYGGNVTGSLADGTATVHALSRSYRPLRADGTLGAAVTSVSLRNGEGAILIKA